MSDMKTVENDASVEDYLNSVENDRRREDTKRVATMMAAASGEPAKMWGDSIVGFGRYNYQRSDGSKHQWMLTGVAPRKAALTVYIMPGVKKYPDLLDKLGKHRHSVSCLYITRLKKIDFNVLTELVSRSLDDIRAIYKVAKPARSEQQA